MITRKDYERRELGLLAPYAAFSAKSKGREYKEAECEFRTAFQRDRDRIIHSEAFRRLEYKTQVFINHEGDYYRTRLTHTIEVAQISRGIVRTLRLNEDLTEAVALAHDLGHTPFGHSGEGALNQMMKNFGGFEHNKQSLRVVTRLEYKYPEFPGLNLTLEVLNGIAKHSNKGASTLEAQIVNLADEIAYINHDLDDGLKSGLLKFEQMKDVVLWRDFLKEVKKIYPTEPESIWKYQIIRRLINLFVTDLQVNTKALKFAKADFSHELKSKISDLKSFLFKNLYRHPRVEKMSDMAKIIIRDLFKKYCLDPSLIPHSFNTRVKASKERRVCDYIAGMTDRFALKEHERLCE